VTDAAGPQRASGRDFGRAAQYLVEAGLFFAVVGVLRLFDIDRASALGGRLGRLIAPLGRRPATIARIREVFPERDEASARALIDEMYESFGRMLAELARLEEFSRPEARARFTFEGIEHIRAAEASGRPICFVSGHFGNWELQVPVMRHLGVAFSDVTQPLKNPYIDRFIGKRRHLAGFTEQIERGAGGTRQLFARLRNGQTVALFIDLRIKEGIPVPLFGKPALTTFSPALFAQSFNAIVVPVALRREEGAHFRFVAHPPVELRNSGNPARDIVDFTAELNRFVETEIRARPAHWMWHQKRWNGVPQLFRRAQQLMDEAAAGSDAA
jgi:KDO2-lipid IV(A) lauroyltransferase